MGQTHPVPTTHQKVTLSSKIPICPQPYSPLLVPQAGYLPQPRTELLMAAAYGIPCPTLPVFESGARKRLCLVEIDPRQSLKSPYSHQRAVQISSVAEPSEVC